MKKMTVDLGIVQETLLIPLLAPYQIVQETLLIPLLAPYQIVLRLGSCVLPCLHKKTRRPK